MSHSLGKASLSAISADSRSLPVHVPRALIDRSTLPATARENAHGCQDARMPGIESPNSSRAPSFLHGRSQEFTVVAAYPQPALTGKARLAMSTLGSRIRSCVMLLSFLIAAVAPSAFAA